jgi:hypothetical protein
MIIVASFLIFGYSGNFRASRNDAVNRFIGNDSNPAKHIFLGSRVVNLGNNHFQFVAQR